MVVADVNNPSTISNMCSQSSLIMNCVGPYILYGEVVVKCCVEKGADYLDVTGEPAFIQSMKTKYNKNAEAVGVLVVSACGMDAIPIDLSVYYTKRKFPDLQKIDGYLDTSKSSEVTYGTWTTVITSLANKGKYRIKLQGGTGKQRWFHYSKLGGGWAIPFPVVDPYIVKWSHEEIEGDQSVDYSHYIVYPFIVALSVMFFLTLVVFFAKFDTTRSFLLKMKKPGDGPSEQLRKKSSIAITLVAQGKHGQKIIKIQGREMYELTAELASQCVLCVLIDRPKLRYQRGFHTTAGAFGDQLLKRIKDTNALIIREEK